jgi:CubicO group peptidase (beta-lactamase class C family)
LLNHTSGLPDYEKLLYGSPNPRSFASSKGPSSPREIDTATALKILIAQNRLDSSPGQKYMYSNSGYVVLGQVVERISGVRYAEFLRGRIFKPLGMNESLVLDERKQEIPLLALGYWRVGDTWRDITYHPGNYVYGMDNVFSTLTDLVKWDTAWNANRLVSRHALETAFTPAKRTTEKRSATALRG